MIIQEIPVQFQPKYYSQYPPYSSGKNMEEIVFDLLRHQGCYHTEYIYLPVFWTSYYIINNYGTTEELTAWLLGLDRSKKYFTVVQYDSGIFWPEGLDLDITVFSAGGGGLNTVDSVKEYDFHGLKRLYFDGRKGDYSIPLICLPQFPCLNLKRDIYYSFAGRFDTHFCRMEMKLALEGHTSVKLYDCMDYHEYVQIMGRSIFTLAPRGYGYTSFRLFEAIYANSIPVYIWDGEIALPFADELNWEEFCVIVHLSDIHRIQEILADVDIEAMQKRLHEVKSMFTFEHIVKYIMRKISAVEERRMSIGIPHYNNSGYIMDAIRPVLRDERVAEIVICDDVSNDVGDLERIVKSLDNPKIKLVKNTENLGPYHNKLKTVSKCTNEWALLLDSDNIISKEFIDRLFAIPDWCTDTIYAPCNAETFPEHSNMLNYSGSANQYITRDVYKQYGLNNIVFMCFANTGNYFLPVQEYMRSMSKYTYSREGIDALDANISFVDWLCNGHAVFIVGGLSYKHRLHDSSNYARNHKDCDFDSIRQRLMDKIMEG